MVATIKFIPKAAVKLYYNEHKVKGKKAECIYAGNFLKDAAELALEEKRRRFSDRAELNQRVINKALNIFIQFTRDDVLSDDTMALIAATYMDRLGFGRQPYLVYRHFDTAIPHAHIVSTPISPNGLQFHSKVMLRYLSWPVCRGIEKDFELSRARGKKPVMPDDRKAVRKIRYGEFPSIEIMAYTLRHVFREYRFRTFPELNAILRQYNLKVREGLPGSRLRSFGGLQYHILDDSGHTVGAPIKASAIEFKPTLKYLETLFKANAGLKPQTILHTGMLWEDILSKASTDPTTFQSALRRSRLAVAPDYSEEGKIKGLLLVNLASRVVVNTNEFGPRYELSAIHKRLGFDPLSPGLLPGGPTAKLHTQRRKGRHL